MSLRDQLFNAGFINKKELRKSNLEAKKARKKKQGNRKKKKVIQKEQQLLKEQHSKQQIEQLRKERQEREAEKVAAAKNRQLTNILRHYAIAMRNTVHPFWHRAADQRYLHKLWVSERTALELRAGRLGIAVEGPLDAFEPNYVIIPAKVVERVRNIEAKRIVFYNETPPDAADPAEKIWGM